MKWSLDLFFLSDSLGARISLTKNLYVKFIFSTVELSYVVPVKSTVEISQNFVAFSEYMNFNHKSNFVLNFLQIWIFGNRVKSYNLTFNGIQ